jgi:exodeoxyribonuclease-3
MKIIDRFQTMVDNVAMKVATFNANSIRSRVEIINSWLAENRPQILCVQETKVQDSEFPLDAFCDRGYHVVFRGQKKYNGVAVFSDQPAETVVTSLPGDSSDEARFLQIFYKKIAVINTYIPQGDSPASEKFQYKLKWFSLLKKYFSKTFTPAGPILWMGDLNVALEDIDVYDPKGLRGSVCFCREVQDALKAMMRWGFVDLFRQFHPEDGQYTFWDYRLPNGFGRNLGWRLDYIMATPSLAQKCIACRIDKTPRGLDKPSDHTFVVAEFKNL